MVRTFALLLVFALAGVSGQSYGADLGVSQVPAVTTAASLTKRVPPRYPAKAIERGQEGWVDLRFTVTPEGTTSDIRIVASFPKGIFDRNAANAVAKWAYTPRTENGTVVPQDNNRATLSFALAESAAIRDPLIAIFNAAFSAVRTAKWDEATKIIKQLTETDALSLFELAALEQLRGEMAFNRKDYAAAADHFARALAITARFEPATRSGISALLVMACINGQDYARAVQTFDAWNPPDTAESRDIRRTVESVRTALAAGRPIKIAPLE